MPSVYTYYAYCLHVHTCVIYLRNVFSVLTSQALPQAEASCVRRQERPEAVANAKAAAQKLRRVDETVLGFAEGHKKYNVSHE
eukprot:s1655_g7.t1